MISILLEILIKIFILLLTFSALFSTFGYLSQTISSPTFLESVQAQENIDLNGLWERDDDKSQLNITQIGSEVIAAYDYPTECPEGGLNNDDPYLEFKGTIDGNQIIGKEASWCYYGSSNPDENGSFMDPFVATISDDGNHLTVTSPNRFATGEQSIKSYSKISAPADAGVSPLGGCTTWTKVIAKIEGPNSVKAGQDVTLDASKSYSESGMDCYDSSNRSRTADVSYFWEQIEGPKIDVIDLSSAIIKFKAPPVDSKTKLMLLLTVTSGDSNDQIPKNITVQPTLMGVPEQPPLNVPEQPPLNVPEQPPLNVPEQPPLNVPEQPPLNVPEQLTSSVNAFPLWLIAIAVIAIAVTSVAVYLARRHSHTDVPTVLEDRVNKRIPKNTIDIITEGGIE